MEDKTLETGTILCAKHRSNASTDHFERLVEIVGYDQNRNGYAAKSLNSGKAVLIGKQWSCSYNLWGDK